MPLPTEKVEEAELEDSDELSSLPILRKADQYKSLNRQKTSVKDLSQKYEAQITENQNIANSSKPNVKTERTKKISIRQSFNNENDMYPYLPLDLSMKEWIREASRNNEDYIRVSCIWYFSDCKSPDLAWKKRVAWNHYEIARAE